MKTLKISPQFASVLGFGALAMVGCNDNPLVPLDPNEVLNLHYVTVDSQFCTSEPVISEQKVKYLFILDHSASNQPLIGPPLVAGDDSSTDPVGAHRYAPLVQFINSIIANPSPNTATSFALLDFNSTVYAPGFPSEYSTINSASPPNPNPTLSLVTQTFDTSASDFLNNYVIPDWEGCFDFNGNRQTCLGTNLNPQPNDGGFTNYVNALAAAQDLIYTDLEAEATSLQTPPVKINYQIIFVTDGYPNTVNGAQNFTSVQGIIDTIIGFQTSNPTLSPLISNISLNTAYYYPVGAVPDASDESLLTQMAAQGNGKAQVFGNGESVAYQSYAPPIRQLKYNLSDVWIENENLVWWDNGQLLLDTDGDGLPDLIEQQMGSNPLLQDSDGNGVSDLVEYRTKGAPCNSSTCSQSGRDPYAVCDGLSPSVDGNGNVTFPYTANDGLNDCEKLVLGGVQGQFDSNGDFLPDLMEFKAPVAFVAGSSGAYANPFGDPLDNYTKLKLGLPLTISQSKVLNYSTRQITLQHIASTTSDNQCYHMIANQVAVYNDGNTIKVSVIQNTAVIDNQPVLQTAVRSLDGASSTIYFAPSDFH
jgi:hypothetical protein